TFGAAVNASSSGGVTTATISTTTLAAGTHTVTATYSSDGNFLASSGSLGGGQVVNSKVATTAAVTASVNPAVFGQSVVFTATISAASGTPTGTVQFVIDGSNAGGLVNVSTSGGVTSASFST